MAYIVSLEAFEGPLDLLLHLIKKNKIDIYDIPIAQITEQYLSYLQAMQELDLEIAGEFLLMAATLLSIKAKMLLPQKRAKEEAEEEDLDPRKELVDRLVEYQKYKQAAEKFRQMQARQALMYSRPLDPYYVDTIIKNVNLLEKVSPEKLKQLLQVLLAEVAKEEKVQEIKKKVITVKDKMDYLEKLLAQKPEGLIFQNLFAGQTSTYAKVVTFLALLELIHQNKVFFVQTSNFGPLYIYPKVSQSRDRHVV